MQNPFVRFYNYITEKPVKQRIYIVIAIVFLLFFAFFLIKGNFFDNRLPDNSENTHTEMSQSESGESVTSDTSNESVTGDTSQSTNEGGPKFHISLIDMVVLLAIIAIFVVKKIREKRKHRRL